MNSYVVKVWTLTQLFFHTANSYPAAFEWNVPVSNPFVPFLPKAPIVNQATMNSSSCSTVMDVHKLLIETGDAINFKDENKPQAECINLYNNLDCSGDEFVRFTPGKKVLFIFFGILEMAGGIYPKIPLLDYTGALRPCYKYCDPRNKHAKNPEEIHLKFYDVFADDEDAPKGVEVIARRKECIRIPVNKTESSSWHYITFHPDSDLSACVELHRESNCGGAFAEYRPYYQDVNLFDTWATSDQGGKSIAKKTQAVSRCGSSCKMTTLPMETRQVCKEQQEIVEGEMIVNYQTNNGSATVDLSNGKCHNLGDVQNNTDSERIKFDTEKYGITSLNTNQHCVLLFGQKDCNRNKTDYQIIVNGFINDFEKNVPGQPKSIMKCGEYLSTTPKNNTQHLTNV